MTDLSIITVSYKGWERLTKSLEALKAFNGRKIKVEVIVVDNRSEDETILSLEARFPSFRFIHNSVNGGFANGCNLGASMAKGEYLLFLNPDTIASEDALEELVGLARANPDLSILSCRQVNEKGKESISSGEFPELRNLTGFLRAIFNSHPAPRTPHPAPRTLRPAPRTPHPAPCNTSISFPGWVSGSVILIQKDLFLNIGGFDEDFWMYFEDVDICKRISDHGGSIAFCNNVTIEHNHGGSSRANIRTVSITKTEVSISRHVYISKHKSGIEEFFIQSFMVLNNLTSGGIMALIGLIFFFNPKLLSRTIIFIRLLKYYSGVFVKRSWISPRSVRANTVK